MEELRQDMKDRFCLVVSEQINDAIAKIVKSHCKITKRKTYIESFRDALSSMDIDSWNLRNLDELERRWNRGETVQIRKDQEVVTLPKKGDFNREYEDIICELPKSKTEIDIIDLLFYTELDEMVCEQPIPVNLSDQDREILRSLRNSRS